MYYLKKKIGTIYTACLSVDDNHVYHYEECTKFAATDSRLMEKLIKFVKTCISELNKKLQNCKVSIFQKVRYIMISEFTEVSLGSRDFETENCKVYECARLININV